MNESSAKFVPANSVVMAMYGATAAQVGVLRKSMTTNQAVCSILPSSNYLPDFLYYYLSSLKVKLVGKAYGAAQPNISQTIIKDIKVPILTHEVQERIVTELDKINELIDKNRELLRHLDSLAQSLFYATFGDPVTNPKGWETYPFGKVCNLSAGGDKPSDTEKERGENRYIPVFSNGIENEGLYGYTSIAKVSEPALTISGRGTLGVPFIRLSPFVPIIRLIVAIPSQNLSLKYLYHLVKSLDLKGNGVAIPQLTVPMIKNIQIPVPPLSLQQQFVAQIEAIEAQKATIEKSIAELQTLLDSRMDYWFN